MPASRAAKRGQARKTIAIWLVLTAMFVVLYRMVGGSTSDGVEVIGGTFAALVVIVFAIAIVRNMRQFRRFNAENSAAVAALGRGELERARTTFWGWAEQAVSPRIAALARHNLAWTLARQGRLAQAIEVATNNDEQHLAGLQPLGLAPTSAVDLALYHALANTLDEARRWLTITDDRRAMLALPSVPAMKAFARAVIECRTGNPAEAARVLDEHWHEYEAVLTGDVARPLRVLRAFARAATDPRQAGVAEMDLLSARPVFPGEYAMLASGWPEMAAFLESQNLSG